MPRFAYPFTHQCTLGLLWYFSYCVQCCLWTRPCKYLLLIFMDILIYPKVELLGHMEILFLIYLFLQSFIYFFVGRGEGKDKERERNIDVRGKHEWVASQTHPQPGTEPTTPAYALTRNRTSDLSPCSTMPNHLSHTSQDYFLFLKGLPYCFPQQLYDFTYPSKMHKGSSFSTSLTTLAVSFFFYSSILMGVRWL